VTLLKRANAKLKCTLKKRKTTDVSKVIQDSMAKEPTVATESMETLMRGILQEELKEESK
jgi:hypothetical protein